MWSTQSRFPVVLIWTIVCAGGTATVAASEKHFEGPYKITIAASKTIRATVTTSYRYPSMVAREWWVANPLPPEFDGQPAARGRFRIMEAPLAEPGRTSDESLLRQPLATLHWFPDTIDGGQGFTVEATYDLTINRRTLERGEPTASVVKLTRAERAAFLRLRTISISPARNFGPGSASKI